MSTFQTLAVLAYLAMLFAAIRFIDITHFVKSRHQQHLVFGTAATLFVLWLLKAGIFEGLDVHFLGLSVLTLMLGFRYALVASGLALFGSVAVGYGSWSSIGVHGLLGTVLPIGVTYLFYMLSFHRLPRQLFIYIFICAFFPAALSMALKTFTLGLFYYFEGIYTWDVVYNNYILLIPLLIFPEALLNGMAITLLVIYQPAWVYTFHDKFYLNK
ncbi:energy-coupling factor ABC transporter permease [Alteromonas sp. D210916BOD_24]|uniref:energy-coupling factor ABC transporter permease n=1 Tax=Alteromonas sp. D210916BOD_24 TaxID=3157618 RepID=UPI00399CA510